jgi:vacuolar protein sorting-associated protein 45
MSCVAAMTEYVLKALSSVSGMKALLLDAETAGMAALVLSQTDAIAREVFLTDRIDLRVDDENDSSAPPRLNARGELERAQPKETLHHLKAVALIRPTISSVQKLRSIMRSGRFKDYYVFFSNLTGDDLLRSLAEGDELELVRQVSELYGDYYALNDFIWHANMPISKPLYTQTNYWSADEKNLLERNCDSIISLLLSFKVRADIRYSGASSVAKMVAMEVAKRQKDESDLFTFQTQTPLLLVLDRADDPITPLLSQWTYQAMVHELIGINLNRVSLASAPGIRKELMEVILSPQLDHFYKGSMYLNFGELGTSVKELVQNFQRKKQTHKKLESIEDMQRFVDEMPEFRAVSGTVSKHVAIMTELSRLVEDRQLMRISELEQELACNSDHGTAMDMLLQILDDPRITFQDKLRLVLLYSLRYEGAKHQIPTFKKMLRDKAGLDRELLSQIRAVDALLKHAGSKVRGGDLFGNKTILGGISKFIKGSVKGIDNIYTQHKPLLTETLMALSTGKLNTKPSGYPYTDVSSANSAAAAGKNKYRLIIIYMVGGYTYEEALAVHTFNESNKDFRVILGGSYVHNSKSFLEDITHGVASNAAAGSSAGAHMDDISVDIRE